MLLELDAHDHDKPNAFDIKINKNRNIDIISVPFHLTFFTYWLLYLFFIPLFHPL